MHREHSQHIRRSHWRDGGLCVREREGRLDGQRTHLRRESLTENTKVVASASAVFVYESVKGNSAVALYLYASLQVLSMHDASARHTSEKAGGSAAAPMLWPAITDEHLTTSRTWHFDADTLLLATQARIYPLSST